MYSIRATAVGVSNTSLDRRRARSDSAPDAGITIMNGTATTTMRKVGGAAGGATAFPSASASASASAAAQSELPLQSARSSHEDDDGPVAGEHRSYSSSGGDTSLSGGASAGRYNRPLHVTDGGIEGPAVEGARSGDRQHRIAMMNGRAATDGHHHRPVAKRDGGAVYPQQQVKQRRAVVAPLDHHRERNASTAATNQTGVGVRVSGSKSPLRRGRATGPGSGVPAAPLTPTRGSGGGGGDGGAASAAANPKAPAATPSYFAATTPKRRPRPSQHDLHGTTPANTPQRVVDSPLIDASRTPPTPLSAPEANLVKHEDRWRAMSALAGPHMQDPTVLDLSHRSHLPFETLKFGVPPKVAANVTHLKYDGAALLGGGGGGGGRRRHDLPAFLDLVCQLFPRLEHISLDGGGSSNEEEENGDGPEGRCGPTAAGLSKTAGPRNGDSSSSGGSIGGGSGDDPKKSRLDAAIEAANRETVRMRRLYLLYRLPDLRSIDGVPVTATERNLARPSSPAGYRVRKEDWLTGAMAAVNNKVGAAAAAVRGGAGTDENAGDKDGDDGASDDDDDGGYYGGGRDSVIDSEDGVGGTCSGSAVEVSICGLVNYVRTPDEGGGEGEGDGALAAAGTDADRSSTLNGRAGGQPSEADAVQLRIDVSDSNDKSKGGGKAVTTPGRSGSTKNGRTASGAPRGSRPPPSPASKLRTFPAPRQKRRGGGGGKRLSSRRLWRQRKNNVVSMVDAEEEEEDGECAADDNAHGGDDYEEDVGGEKENGVHWAGTLETISYMEGTTDQNKQP